MNRPNPLNAELVVSYLTLRKAIGVIGLLMPIVVRIGAHLFEGIPSNESISAYYYTGMNILLRANDREHWPANRRKK